MSQETKNIDKLFESAKNEKINYSISDIEGVIKNIMMNYIMNDIKLSYYKPHPNI